MEQRPVIVIGAGGAGLLAAWRAAVLGAPVVLLERNAKPGIKLLISGGGKCNITHAGTMEEVRQGFLPREARFLKPAFYRFSNSDMIRLLDAEGVRTFARPNGRVFPASGRAGDVVQAILSLLHRSGVDLRVATRVERILHREGKITGVVANGVTLPSSHVILATGGVSYPKTGTTGDGLAWAYELGHTIVPVRPALAPIGVQPPLPASWRGIALRSGVLSIHANGRKLYSWHDDILMTHEGISGPAALEVSRFAAVALEESAVALSYDFFPSKEFPALDAELNEKIQAQRGKVIATILDEWLPNRIVPTLLQGIHINPDTRGHVLTAEQRRAIVHLLKEWHIGDVAFINIERGEVTAGGIALAEVDPQTMRSRKMHGLYPCGEVLDIAGPVGGYNLQAAFSTGYTAGETAGKDWVGERS